MNTAYVLVLLFWGSKTAVLIPQETLGLCSANREFLEGRYKTEQVIAIGTCVSTGIPH